MARKLDPEQQQTVQSVLRVARRKKASPRVRKAALLTPRVEADYRSPDQAHSDRDSEGPFQQRPSQGWGPTSETTEQDAAQFIERAQKLNDQGFKGSAGELAQAVQRSAYPDRYDAHSAEADALLRRYGAGGGTSGGSAASSSTPARLETGTVSSFDQAGFDQASKRAKVGSLLARRKGTDSILFRSGLLSTTAPDPADFTSEQRTSKIIPGTSGRDPLGAAAAHGAKGRAVKAAAERIGVAEVGGSNRGQRVDKWQAKFGMVGQPWCGIAVGIFLKEAGVKITPRVASVSAIEEDAKSGSGGFKSWHSPREAQSGDALITRKGDHVGFVEKVDRKRGLIFTIEGNTGSGEVARRQHKMSDVYGIARPRYGRRG